MMLMIDHMYNIIYQNVLATSTFFFFESEKEDSGIASIDTHPPNIFDFKQAGHDDCDSHHFRQLEKTSYLKFLAYVVITIT